MKAVLGLKQLDCWKMTILSDILFEEPNGPAEAGPYCRGSCGGFRGAGHRAGEQGETLENLLDEEGVRTPHLSDSDASVHVDDDDEEKEKPKTTTTAKDKTA